MADSNGAQCPESTLGTVYPDECKPMQGLAKVSQCIFQNIDDTPLTGNTFVDGTNGIDLVASWAGLPDAINNSKVTVTPLLSEAAWAAGEVVEGTENADGATTADGTNPSMFSAIIENASPAQVKVICDLAYKGQLGVYFLYRNNRIQAREITDTPATYAPIRISPETFMAGDPAREATNFSKFQFTFQFKLEVGWYANSQIIAPEDGFSYSSIKPTTP